MRLLRTTLAGFLILLAAAPVHARTWRVERDGSGDFVVIQDAVDAASAGDVIQIGPGRFDEWEFVDGDPEYPAYVRVEKDLIFVGAGMGETIVGPTSVDVHPPTQPYVVGFSLYRNGINISISDLTVENCRERGISLYQGRLQLDRCEIRGCVKFGVFGRFPLGGWVRDCSFHDIGTWGMTQGVGLDFYTPSVGVEVTRSTFTDINGYQAGAWWAGCRDIDINNCQFEHGTVGAGFTDGASGSIRYSTFDNFSNFGIALIRSGNVAVEDNSITQLGAFAGTGVGVWYTAQRLVMRRNVVVSDSRVLNFDALVQAGEISGNHFLREGSEAWWVHTGDYYPLTEPRIITLENNYWGTTDTALLDQWIYDGNDNEDVDIFIDYLPLADGPVQTQPTTWGAVKSLFR